MSGRGCHHLLLVGLVGQQPAAFCVRNLFGGYACPRTADTTYPECPGYQEGEPLVRLFSNEGAEANAFHPPILQADPAFVEIMIQFMVPDWRAQAESGPSRGRTGGASASWFGLKASRPSTPPPPAAPPAPRSPRRGGRPSPLGGHHHEESFLESGEMWMPAIAAEPAFSSEPATPPGEASRPPSAEAAKTEDRSRQGHVPDQPYRSSAINRLERSRSYLGDLHLVDRRGLLQVEGVGEKSLRRLPLTLLWHSSYGSGRLLLGPSSASRRFVVFGTQLRRNPQDTSLWARHDIACALDMQHGDLLWRWRNMFLACPPQILEGVVLLRRLDTLWAVDEATGQRLWDEPAEAEPSGELGLADGKVIFHTGRRFRAIDLKTGMKLWESGASARSPRPVAAGPRIVLAADDHIRAVSGSSGMELWRLGCHGPENRVPAVSDSHVVFWTWDAHLHAVRSSTGRRAWSVRGRTFYPGDDPVLSEGWVLVRDGDLGDPCLVALDEEGGRVRWQVPLEDTLPGSLGVFGRQVILLNTQGEVVALERDTGRLLWRLSCPASGLVLSGDRLLVWSEGVLYCYVLSP